MNRKEDAFNVGYSNSINKAINFIDHNLDQELSLEIVAAIACYSPFHFHRIFKAVMNEPLNGYITRKRIEKAASILMRKKEVTITALSLKYGFNGNSSFTRAFKKFYGINPTEFRNNCHDKFSKISKANSKNGQEIVVFEKYICAIDHQQTLIKMDANIEIKEMPLLNLAYISHVGHANLAGTYGRLMQWAKPKGLLDTIDFKMVTVYHDSFKITAPDKVRMSACILLNKTIETDGEVSLRTIDKGKFVVGHFEIAGVDFGKTWTELYIWLNKNGYKTTDRNCFEIYHSDPEKHPEKKYTVDFCIPID